MYYNVSTIIVFSHFALEIQTLCNDPGIKADDAAWILFRAFYAAFRIFSLFRKITFPTLFAIHSI